LRLFLHKLFHWEYWPFQIVYIPIYFLWLVYAIRARTIFFFNTCNPSMKYGGFMMDSKKGIYDLIPQKYYPKTQLISEKLAFEKVKGIIENTELYFPLIVKPDIGLRGSAVKKVYNLEELKKYHYKADFDYLVQDLIPFENEIGIFYVRFPLEKKGRITGIVAKEFMILEGDGFSTIERLLKANPRYGFQLKALEKEYGNQLKTVLSKGEKRNLVPYGSHARGAKFIDYSNHISEKLSMVIDEICHQIPEFYYGRMDVMFNTFEELEEGKNFSIVELNGAASEPTHIYDPKHSLFFGWKELFRHIGYMFKISVENNKRGCAFLTHKEGMKLYRLHKIQFNKIYNF
jgi:hypothetical protein